MTQWYIAIGKSPTVWGGMFPPDGLNRYGEIHTATQCSWKDPLDEAGTFSFEMPASDPVAQYLNKAGYHGVPADRQQVTFYAMINGVLAPRAAGLIDSIELSVDAEGKPTGMLTVSGNNILEELSAKLISDIDLFPGDDELHGITLFFPDGWQIIGTADDSADGAITPKISILAGLIELIKMTGEHFRFGDWITPYNVGGVAMGGWRQVEWLPHVFTSSGWRAFYGVNPLAAEGAAKQCVITKIVKNHDTHEVFAGRYYSHGVGPNGENISLGPPGVNPPGLIDGYDANWTIHMNSYHHMGYYLEHTPTWNLYGIEKAALYSVADTTRKLIRMTIKDMARQLAPIDQYTIEIVGLPEILRAGQTIRVVAHGFIDGYHEINIDQDLNILTVNNKLDNNGTYSVSLTCSSIDVKLPTDTSVMIGAMTGTTSSEFGRSASPIKAHNLLADTHTDTTADTPVDGDVLIGNATPSWSRLGISVPIPGSLNVLGIEYGELRPAWKTITPGTPAITPATIVPNSSGIVDDSATWDGYTMGQVVAALRMLRFLS